MKRRRRFTAEGKRRLIERRRLQCCQCGGYWFPHRRGGGACDHSIRRDYYVARREGMSHLEALAMLPTHVLELTPWL